MPLMRGWGCDLEMDYYHRSWLQFFGLGGLRVIEHVSEKSCEEFGITMVAITDEFSQDVLSLTTMA